MKISKNKKAFTQAIQDMKDAGINVVASVLKELPKFEKQSLTYSSN